MKDTASAGTTRPWVGLKAIRSFEFRIAGRIYEMPARTRRSGMTAVIDASARSCSGRRQCAWSGRHFAQNRLTIGRWCRWTLGRVFVWSKWWSQIWWKVANFGLWSRRPARSSFGVVYHRSLILGFNAAIDDFRQFIVDLILVSSNILNLSDSLTISIVQLNALFIPIN